MKAGRGISVCDLYSHLPPYGESTVDIDCKQLNLVITIAYKSVEIKPDPDRKINLKFSDVSSFYEAAYPGVNIMNIEYDYPINSSDRGSLIEYPDSEAAIAWRQHFEGHFRINHYQIIFLASNIKIEVFAEEFELVEAC